MKSYSTEVLAAAYKEAKTAGAKKAIAREVYERNIGFMGYLYSRRLLAHIKEPDDKRGWFQFCFPYVLFALCSFDIRRGYKFSSFLVPRLMAAVNRYQVELAGYGGTKGISNWTRERQKWVREYASALASGRGEQRALERLRKYVRPFPQTTSLNAVHPCGMEYLEMGIHGTASDAEEVDRRIDTPRRMAILEARLTEQEREHFRLEHRRYLYETRTSSAIEAAGLGSREWHRQMLLRISQKARRLRRCGLI